MIKWRAAHSGFTIVELIVVIVVIGILASVSIVSYNGIQRRSVSAVLQTDLTNASSAVSLHKSQLKVYPTTIPSDVRPSQGVTLALSGTDGTYSGLSAVQSGVLYHSICQQLLAEGYGKGVNGGGGTETYITSCNVYVNGYIHINGWNSVNLNTPIASNSLSSYYNTAVAANPWFPNIRQIYQDFANQLSSRYVAKGGTFPITSFWSNSNNPVPYQALPTPTLDPYATTYCVQARHERYPDMVWHIESKGKPAEGACS